MMNILNILELYLLKLVPDLCPALRGAQCRVQPGAAPHSGPMPGLQAGDKSAHEKKISILLVNNFFNQQLSKATLLLVVLQCARPLRRDA